MRQQQRPQAPQRMTRRAWLAMTATGMAVSGCGGGSVLGLSVPGTGGTGIVAQGPITGFGSVILNGIKFDDNAASVTLDGLAALPADLRLGMAATVQGQRGSTSTSAFAQQIQVWSVAQGGVTQINGNQLSVAGMTLQAGVNTVCDGFTSVAALSPGQAVKAWGTQATADGTAWNLSRLALVASATVVTTGLLSVTDDGYYVNFFLLTGSLPAGLKAGQLVRVQGTTAGAGLQVASVVVLSAASGGLQTGDVNLDGVITAVNSSTSFSIGSTRVNMASATLTPSNLQISVGVHVQVQGFWQNGQVMAETVALDNDDAQIIMQMQAPIQQFTSIASFVVRNQLCDGSALSGIDQGTLARLAVGVVVSVQGYVSGNTLNLFSLAIA